MRRAPPPHMSPRWASSPCTQVRPWLDFSPGDTQSTGLRTGSRGRSGGADGGVLPAVGQELVHQERVLPEVQVDVAGQQVGSGEAFVSDRVALGVEHLVGRAQSAVVAGDTAPVELM